MNASNVVCYPRVQEILNFYCDKQSVYHSVFDCIKQFSVNYNFCLYIGYFKHFSFDYSFANNIILEPFQYYTILSNKKLYSTSKYIYQKSSYNIFNSFKNYEDFLIFKGLSFDKIIMLHFLEYQIELRDLFLHMYPLLSDRCEILIFMPFILDCNNGSIFNNLFKMQFLELNLEKVIKEFNMFKVENHTIFVTIKRSVIKIPVFKVIKIAKKNLFDNMVIEDQVT